MACLAVSDLLTKALNDKHDIPDDMMAESMQSPAAAPSSAPSWDTYAPSGLSLRGPMEDHSPYPLLSSADPALSPRPSGKSVAFKRSPPMSTLEEPESEHEGKKIPVFASATYAYGGYNPRTAFDQESGSFLSSGSERARRPTASKQGSGTLLDSLSAMASQKPAKARGRRSSSDDITSDEVEEQRAPVAEQRQAESPSDSVEAAVTALLQVPISSELTTSQTSGMASSASAAKGKSTLKPSPSAKTGRRPSQSPTARPHATQPPPAPAQTKTQTPTVNPSQASRKSTSPRRASVIDSNPLSPTVAAPAPQPPARLQGVSKPPLSQPAREPAEKQPPRTPKAPAAALVETSVTPTFGEAEDSSFEKLAEMAKAMADSARAARYKGSDITSVAFGNQHQPIPGLEEAPEIVRVIDEPSPFYGSDDDDGLHGDAEQTEDMLEVQ